MLSPTSTARLQGWATLENQSGADWQGVSLTLQYGNPVTFRQALYRSYFVQRPEVPVEILGRILPDIDTAAKATLQDAIPAPAGMAAPRAMAMAAPAPPPVMAAPTEQARADETGEETIFTLAQPVDLAAGHSANLPIIDRTVPAPKIGLVPFQKPHPLTAVRIRNDEQRSLPAGVLTLYDSAVGASFAGDARLGGLPAGETRLLSFAQDLRTTVDTKVSSQPDFVAAVTVADGVLTYTLRTRQVIRINVAAPAKEARELLLEIPRLNGDQTVSFDDGKTRVSEQTATAYRIGLSLAAAEARTVTAFLDAPVRQTVALVDGNESIIQAVVASDKLSTAARQALGRLLDLRRDEARRQADIAQQKKTLAEVQEDEDRIRKNLAAVSASDALRTRLTKSLDADETRIETIRKYIDDVQQEADKAHRALTDAVAALRI
jgi:hypothetical protein